MVKSIEDAVSLAQARLLANKLMQHAEEIRRDGITHPSVLTLTSAAGMILASALILFDGDPD